MKKLFAVAASLALAIGLAGCPATSFERTAYQTLAATQATVNQAQADYEAGKLIPHNQAAYKAINEAKAAQTLAVDALEAYEQAKATNATPGKLAALQADVAAALAALPGIVTDVKALYQGVK